MTRLLSAAIVAALFLECYQLCIAAPSDCWTDWLNSDDPSGTGDFETVDGLRQQYPGKICPKPLDIQAQTLSGNCVSKTGDEIYKMDTKEGFICRNQDQCKKGMCEDYQVRFRCPPSFCNRGCWTPWFDRDNPSGTGDWETLSHLRRENQGKICSNPTRMDVQTVGGGSVASTGDQIYKNDTQYGFVCRNQDQGGKWCQDYRVRFWCPAPFSCGGGQGCWTPWFDRDNPSGTGDWETLSHLRRENQGKICSNPTRMDVQTVGGGSVASTGDQIYKNDTQYGFVCRNQDQGGKWCQDYRVRFWCPAPFSCGGGQGCWTPWFDRDNPSGTGDWETLSSLRRENQGKICSNPTRMDVQTVGGGSVASTGDQIYKNDTQYGFVCRNQDQGGKWCQDYRVRFWCPAPFSCGGGQGCWTPWFDRDNPSGTGDWETLSSLRRENQGKICSNPTRMDVQTVGGGSVASTGDQIYKNDTQYGFVCRNQDQGGKWCQDYRVRFWCPAPFSCGGGQGCWTPWFDRDNPSGTGDWEILSNLRRENQGKICSNPTRMDVQTVGGGSVASTGDQIYKNDTQYGFVCRNQDQGGKWCQDYRVRFWCPAPFSCGGGQGCWTPWFDRDNPSGTGDWETLSHLRHENRGKICTNPTRMDVQTVGGGSVASTGDQIYKNDTQYGFVCRNQDQGGKWCQDYRVRFWCPAPFSCGGGQVCWTKWFDHDNPTGTGDWEDLSGLLKHYPGQVCAKPVSIDVVTTDTQTPATATGQIFEFMSPEKGFVCRNSSQRGPLKFCRDYKVRFGCPC